ncbi:uncharacterized protein LOC124655020 [Lolium rigidum]|uniref:uncharacterized protein LOC124655020 n=1 Tax=Lolium rigidum TaxID=89674 RepID=UPI001F5C41BA|nr:uncharacterized protein LOC124655020 [Lolium rigidum]
MGQASSAVEKLRVHIFIVSRWRRGGLRAPSSPIRNIAGAYTAVLVASCVHLGSCAKKIWGYAVSGGNADLFGEERLHRYFQPFSFTYGFHYSSANVHHSVVHRQPCVRHDQLTGRGVTFLQCVLSRGMACKVRTCALSFWSRRRGVILVRR